MHKKSWHFHWFLFYFLSIVPQSCSTTTRVFPYRNARSWVKLLRRMWAAHFAWRKPCCHFLRNPVILGLLMFPAGLVSGALSYRLGHPPTRWATVLSICWPNILLLPTPKLRLIPCAPAGVARRWGRPDAPRSADEGADWSLFTRTSSLERKSSKGESQKSVLIQLFSGVDDKRDDGLKFPRVFHFAS